MRKLYIIHLEEPVEICGELHVAKIDTGASRSSIDVRLANRLGLTEIVKLKEVKSANGKSVRPIIRGKIKIGNRNISTTFNLADRKEMKFDLILGRNFLRKGFLIDTSKQLNIPNEGRDKRGLRTD